MDGDADAKVMLMTPPPENWKSPPGHPRITWLNTIQRDLRACNLTLNEAVKSGSEPHSVEADVYVWRYALLVVHASKKEEEEVALKLTLKLTLLSLKVPM